MTWTIEVTGEVDRVVLLLDEEELPLRPAEGEERRWSRRRRIERTRLVALRLERDGQPPLHTPLARLEVIADQPPQLEVIRPQPLVELDPRAPRPVTVEVTAEDDYGLAAVELVATLATGSGENVRVPRTPPAVQPQPRGVADRAPAAQDPRPGGLRHAAGRSAVPLGRGHRQPAPGAQPQPHRDPAAAPAGGQRTLGRPRPRPSPSGRYRSSSAASARSSSTPRS